MKSVQKIKSGNINKGKNLMQMQRSKKLFFPPKVLSKQRDKAHSFSRLFPYRESLILTRTFIERECIFTYENRAGPTAEMSPAQA